MYVSDSGDSIGLVFDYSGELAFAEYVGNGGNCDDSYSGSDAWDCHVFTGTSPYEGVDKWVGATVAYYSDEYPDEYPYIVYQDTSLDDSVLYECDSTNCAGSGVGNWDSYTIYEGSTGNDFGMHPTTDVTSAYEPVVAFSSFSTGDFLFHDVYYGEFEQEEDDPSIPEFSSYKAVIFVAMAAFGMFIVVMLAYKRKKK